MTQQNAFQALGFFMVAWSSLETVLEVAIKKELGVTDKMAEITTSSLGFMSKSSILTSLLKLHDAKHESAIALLNNIVGEAKRNAIVHGRIFMNPEGSITFVKSNVSNSYRAKKITFSSVELNNHAAKLSSNTMQLQQLLNIDESELVAFADIGLSHSA